MPMLCSNCGQTKPEAKFFLEAHNRFVAFCEECREIANAKTVPPEKMAVRIEARPMRPRREPATVRRRPDGFRVLDAGIARDVAFVIDQLREHDHAAKR